MIQYIIILILSLLSVILLLIIRQMKHAEGITKDWMWSIRATHDDSIKVMENQNWNLKDQIEKLKVVVADREKDIDTQIKLRERVERKLRICRVVINEFDLQQVVKAKLELEEK